jgi:hypothetical protein
MPRCRGPLASDDARERRGTFSGYGNVICASHDDRNSSSSCYPSSKRASEADAKLKRLYDAIENGIADLSDPMLKDRIAELKAIRDQARVDAERAEDAIERSITPQALKTFARQARKRMRTESGGYRRDHLRALSMDW